MRKIALIIFLCFCEHILYAQKLETVYLNPKDSTLNMYIAVIPERVTTKAFMFLMDGFGARSADVLKQTDLALYAARKGILTIIPVLKTGPLYFGVDSASQASLIEMIKDVVQKYQLQGKDLYVGGFSIGGSCVVKYAELANKRTDIIKPKAVFALDPPLDWERYYNSAKRAVRLAGRSPLNGEITYMISRIEKEMKGTPENAIANYYHISPYSFSDTTQRAVKALIKTPVMLIAEPDISWWLAQRGDDYATINIIDNAAMINELQKLGNKNAILVTTTMRGYREPGHIRHPHSWSIANKEEVVKWLLDLH